MLFYIQKEHTKSILAIGFDEIQIVSSSMDNTILIWNFTESPTSLKLNPPRSSEGSAMKGVACGCRAAAEATNVVIKLIF